MNINDIQREMREKGSHWWDARTMECFGTKVSSPVFEGPGGIYFVTAEYDGGYRERPKRYTVRQYIQDTRDIRTYGKLGRYADPCKARSAARRLAAGDLGVKLVKKTSAKHQLATPAEDLVKAVEKSGGKLSNSQAKLLIRKAKLHHRYMEMRCGDGSIYQEANAELGERQYRRVERAIEKLIDMTGCGVEFSGDPRGATVKLAFVDGTRYAVPTST